MYLTRYFSFCLILLITFEGAASPLKDEVTVFDVGQGNCVLVKHGNEGILIDAGSSENAFSALYDRLFGYHVTQRYRLRANNSASSSTSSTSLSKEEDTDSDCDDIMGSEVSSETDEDAADGAGNVDTEKAPTVNTKNSIVKKGIATKIREKLPNKNGLFKLTTVVISHPDVDHYNLMSYIFAQDVNFKIGTVVLGGRWEQYNTDLKNWLRIHYYGRCHPKKPKANKSKTVKRSGSKAVKVNYLSKKILPTNKIKKVIFTGAINGHVKEKNKEPSLPYARAYSSMFKKTTKSPREKAIEEALQFKSKSNQKPTIEILAMNVGYKEPLDTYKDENDGKTEKSEASNTSSIVLRIEGKKASFTITGDADGCTWDFIEGCYLGDTAKLETDYLLLSHHGALRNGPSRESTLKILKPKVCLISTGRHAKYGHPREEIIERLIRLKSIKTFSEKYPLTYFKSDKGKYTRIRQDYDHMICSTIDDGSITFDLIDPDNIKLIVVSRSRKEFIKCGQQDIYFTEVTKVSENKEDISFYKHSSMYDLIIPSQENFEIEDNRVYYLKHLKNGEIYEIIKKN